MQSLITLALERTGSCHLPIFIVMPRIRRRVFLETIPNHPLQKGYSYPRDTHLVSGLETCNQHCYYYYLTAHTCHTVRRCLRAAGKVPPAVDSPGAKVLDWYLAHALRAGQKNWRCNSPLSEADRDRRKIGIFLQRDFVGSDLNPVLSR
jgi:hypothetical protein